MTPVAPGGWSVYLGSMTLHLKPEVGVRELRDQRSKYVRHVADGGEVVVTMRARPARGAARPRAGAGAFRGAARRRRPGARSGERTGVRSRRRAATLIVYVDTSALVKLVFDEDGSDVAAEPWDRADALVASVLTYAEARA